MIKYEVSWQAKAVSFGENRLPPATARVLVATEERARQLVADGAANGVVRTYRPVEVSE